MPKTIWNKHTNNLAELYQDWLSVNNIFTWQGAEAILEKEDLTEKQKEFLQSFINVWLTVNNKDYEV